MKIFLIFALLLSGCANHNRGTQEASPAPSPSSPSPSPSPTVGSLNCGEFSLPSDLLGTLGQKEVALRLSQYIEGNEGLSLERIEECLDRQFQISCENQICTITEREK